MLSDEINHCIYLITNHILTNDVNYGIYPKKDLIKMLTQMIFLMRMSDSFIPDGKRTITPEQIKIGAREEAKDIILKMGSEKI